MPVEAAGPEHGAELGHERTGRSVAGPHVAPAAVELIGQHRDDVGACDVLLEHLDRGAVPTLVDILQHRSRCLVIMWHRCAFGDRELEAHREVEFLCVAGANPQPSALEFERLEPRCGGA